LRTVKRVEADLGARVSDKARSKLRRALEITGVEFIEENGGGPGVRLQKTAAEEELGREEYWPPARVVRHQPALHGERPHGRRAFTGDCETSPINRLEFIDEDGGGVGVWLRSRNQKKT
jgi:hypothetical protein